MRSATESTELSCASGRRCGPVTSGRSGPLAQLVEHRPYKAGVGGSSPSRSTRISAGHRPCFGVRADVVPGRCQVHAKCTDQWATIHALDARDQPDQSVPELSVTYLAVVADWRSASITSVGMTTRRPIRRLGTRPARTCS